MSKLSRLFNAHPWLLPVFAFLIAVLVTSFLTGCAGQVSMRTTQIVTATAANLKVPELEDDSRPCPGAALPKSDDAKSYAAFGVLQTGQLELCDGRRALAVERIKLHNLYVARLTNDLRPLRWWEKIIGRRPTP